MAWKTFRLGLESDQINRTIWQEKSYWQNARRWDISKTNIYLCSNGRSWSRWLLCTIKCEQINQLYRLEKTWYHGMKALTRILAVWLTSPQKFLTRIERRLFLFDDAIDILGTIHPNSFCMDVLFLLKNPIIKRDKTRWLLYLSQCGAMDLPFKYAGSRYGNWMSPLIKFNGENDVNHRRDYLWSLKCRPHPEFIKLNRDASFKKNWKT